LRVKKRGDPLILEFASEKKKKPSKYEMWGFLSAKEKKRSGGLCFFCFVGTSKTAPKGKTNEETGRCFHKGEKEVKEGATLRGTRRRRKNKRTARDG